MDDRENRSDPVEVALVQLEEWENAHAENEAAAPSIREARERARLELDRKRALAEAGLPVSEASQEAGSLFGDIAGRVPRLYVPSQDLLRSLGTASVNVAAHAVSGHLVCPTSLPTVELAAQRQRQYELVHVKKEDVRKSLERLLPTLVPLFDQANSAVLRAQRDPNNLAGAGADVRAFLEKFQGELWSRSKKAGEQKVNWTAIGERLCSDPDGVKLIQQQGVVWSSLMEALGKVVHLRPGHNLEAAFTTACSLCHVVLTHADRL